MIKNKLKNNRVYPERSRRGFVILFAVVLSSIILTIALSIANVSQKEIRFGTNARDANDAFFSADTGIECALFNDKASVDAFPIDGNATISCLGNNVNLVFSNSGSVVNYSFIIPSLGSTGQSCAKVNVQKDFTDLSNVAVSINSKGYNNGGVNCIVNANSVERELLVTY